MTKLITGFLLTSALLFADAFKSFPKTYYTIKESEKQKEMFVKILYPLILQEEEKIGKERRFVETFFAKFQKEGIVTPDEIKRLERLAKKYRIKSLYDKEAYLKRIDTVPVSMVLAQASIESNWGKSRFAREANNLFGEWTWGKRGIVPKNRPEGERYKIRIFDSLEDSIASYMRNLNRHWAYKAFREARYEARKAGKPFGGFVAAAYLTHYSQLGEKYTHMVKRTIEKYAWDLYDLQENAPNIAFGNEMVMLSKEIYRGLQ
ncbi:glucosaminidase domain-containing protein [Hydrogenimonas cancrithermarum]|uniref:Mannosyl-glycoprotein endo-beta-N-acetylglucosamidase n=1 Tax=Hydrogenimonas cancrithermarum TaxID=2993563 RepID=A0ABN6WY85_9BACT|nr:glucosaminidase domain-containing protein [Hydrogenimonas cancrithermarum]BDY13155.1 mannosyl-glycoprotein endo-beta-N-acetylglucosamidase [Hydrogenimonas cancrithermarum]